VIYKVTDQVYGAELRIHGVKNPGWPGIKNSSVSGSPLEVQTIDSGIAPASSDPLRNARYR